MLFIRKIILIFLRLKTKLFTLKKIIIILFFLPLFLNAQNIKGIVVSTNKNLPIVDVNVNVSDRTKTLTNDKGEFILKLPIEINEKTMIEFSHIGFTSLKISLDSLKNMNFKVSLSEETENLSGLTIPANHELKLKSKLNYSKLASLPYKIFAFGSYLKDGKIYIVGGSDSSESNALETIKAKNISTEDPRFLQKYLNELASQHSSTSYKDGLLVYDIKKDVWQTSEVKFKRRAFNNLNYYNNKIYVLGGKRISTNGKFEYLENQIEVFDLDKQNITIDKTYPHQASNAASFTYKDNIIVMGGSVKATEQGKKEFTNKVHLYNITSGYWYELADMPIAMETSGTVIGNKIYLIGGSNGKPLSEIETFDLVTEKWDTEGNLFAGLENPAVTVDNAIIYFFEDGKMGVYDTKSKQLKEYLVELNVKSSGMYFFDHKLYIVGGKAFTNYATGPTANTYSIDIDEFETTKPNRIKFLSPELNLAKATQ